LVLLCIFVVWNKVSTDNANVSTQTNEGVDVGEVNLSELGKVSDGLASSAKSKTLEVNGQLKVNNSLVFDPSDPPASPVKGQVYYDKTSNVPMYYDGTKFVSVASKQDVEAARPSVQVADIKPAATVVVDIPKDIAQTARTNMFTNDNSFMRDVSVSGFTSLQSTSIASLVLSQPLSVASGGTGASALASNGVIIGGGSGALTSVTAGSTGLCLMSTAGAPSFQACPSGGSTPNAVTSTSNTVGRLARFGAGNTVVDSLLSDNGSSVSIAGNLDLGAYNLQLGNNGFGMTLNTTTLSANRSISLPDESGVVCLQNSTACGFVTGTPANFIQNQNAGAQSSASYWIAGVGRVDGGLIGPSFDVATAGDTLTIAGTNASVVNIANGSGGITANIATGVGSQNVVIGSVQYSSGLQLQAGSLGISLTSGGAIYTRYNDQIVFGNTSGANHLSINGTTGEINTTYESSLKVNGNFRVTGATAQFDRGITITNLAGLPTYTTPMGTSLQTAINIPNYTMAAYASILSLGMDRLAPDSARAILVADAREYAHQPTIGVLSQNESDILGLSWEGQNGIGYIKTLGAGVGIASGSNVTARFYDTAIELNRLTQVDGGFQVTGGGSGFRVNSSSALLVQDANSFDLLRADTNTMKLTARELEVTYNLVIGGNITVGGHFRSLGTTPTNSPAAASCTSPTVSVSGNDIAGMLTVVAGTGCGATGEIAAVLFANQFYETLPTVTITAANAATADLNTFVDSGTMTLNGFDISTTTPLTSGVTYKWYYHVIQ